jgi:hypothetical protein
MNNPRPNCIAEPAGVSEAFLRSNLVDPGSIGLVVVKGLFPELARRCLSELNQLAKRSKSTITPWIPAGETYINARGIEIVQAHDVIAFDSNDDSTTFYGTNDQGEISELYANYQEVLPEMMDAADIVTKYMQQLNVVLPSLLLSEWEPNEITYHGYNAGEDGVGLSPHIDNARFRGAIAIFGIDKIADLVVGHRYEGKKFKPDAEVRIEPGDLALLRAPGLFNGCSTDHRPEHAVIDPEPGRISLMLRSNSGKPFKDTDGFKFNNRPETLTPN